MTLALTLVGAGGKMGTRITDALADDSAYDVRHVEPGEDGRERLRERGVEPIPLDDALDGTDAVVMAVPDEVIGDVCTDVIERLDGDALILLLDPAAAYAGALPDSDGVSYVVAHPCHPPLFTDGLDVDPDARANDYFGGDAAQSVVCALHRGDEADYDRGARIARDVYAPVIDVHRLTTEQMAILEPALVETVTATLLYAMREGLERAVEMGVPEAAARDFLYGHLRTEAAIVFGEADFPLSDAAQAAVEDAIDDIFTDGWADAVFDREAVRESTARIASE
ncbi:MAG: phosphogluconate dehydrogenase C-terminal domain-containing protein [Halobacteriaceae archaeon]